MIPKKIITTNVKNKVRIRKSKFEISKWNIISAWNQIFNQIKKDDIIKDVFDYLDFEILLGKESSNLIKKIEDVEYFPKKPKRVFVAKNLGLHRPIMIIDIEDRLVFQVLVNKIAPVFDNYLPPGVFNDRVSKSKNKLFISWYENWPKYQKNSSNL